MINSSNLKSLRVLDFYQVLKDITLHLKKHKLNQPNLASRATALQQALEELDLALKPLRGSAATEKLTALDHQRDQALVGFSAQLRSFAKHNKPELKEAARQLQMTLEKYGKKPQELPLREETAMITQFLQDMEKPENTAALALIYADSWVEEMSDANTKFDDLYNSRTQEGAKMEVGAVKTARARAQKAFDDLVRGLNSHADLNDAQEYKVLEDEINYEVKQAKSSLRPGKTDTGNAPKS